jgi:SPP1 gp7 family putative phage head morphogenesis protein
MASSVTITKLAPVLNKDPQAGRLPPKQLKKYIDGIYDGSITEYNLSEEVYDQIVGFLKDGLYKGFGMTLEEAEGADLELLAELRENVYMFGAAKNYQQTKEISSLLFDKDGELRTADEFNDVARETYDNWTDNWGETEYQTAIGQGNSAAKWNDIEAQKDVLPNLRYSAILDDNTSEICAPLDGLVAPIDDPIWATVTPLNHFNCRCVLLQEDGDAELTPDDEKGEAFDKVDSEMSDTFKGNPGKDGMVFTEDHPYFEVAKEDRGYAKRNFDLPIPDKD